MILFKIMFKTVVLCMKVIESLLLTIKRTGHCLEIGFTVLWMHNLVFSCIFKLIKHKCIFVGSRNNNSGEYNLRYAATPWKWW